MIILKNTLLKGLETNRTDGTFSKQMHLTSDVFNLDFIFSKSVTYHIKLVEKERQAIYRAFKMETESVSGEIGPLTKTTLASEKVSVERPFSCSVCKKSFTCNSKLSVHKRVHTGEKPFPCSVCRKGFGSTSDLARHMRVHTGEKPYSCNVCGSCFKQKSNLYRHMKTHTYEVSLVDNTSSSNTPRINESTAVVNYVGISHNESFGDMSVKEEVDPLGELPMTEEFDPAVQSLVKEEFNPLDDIIEDEIDSLEIKEEMILEDVSPSDL